MRNEALRVEINLARGAHVTSCRYKGFEDAEIVL